MFSLVFFASQIHAQILPPGITDQIESYLEEQDEDLDIIALYERLRLYSEKQLNINNAEIEDLQELRLLSDIQINDLLNHIELFGELISIEELQSVPSFTIHDIRRILPFVAVKDPSKLNIKLNEMLGASKNELYLKWSRILEEKKGYIENAQGEKKYRGDPSKYFVRWRSNYENKLRLGFILEKDPGEALFKESENLGFDYLTVHMFLKDYSHLLKDIAIGDYTISLGQGLISHNSFGAGKSAWVTNVKKGGRVIRPYNSVNENGFYRGLATTLRPTKNVEWSIFASSDKRDGNMLEMDTIDVDEPAILFSSLQTSGNHRTDSEIADKDVIGIKSFGTSIKYKKRNFSLAFNNLNYYFNGSLDRSDQLYNAYRFEGDQLSNYSFDFSYRYLNYNFFGEGAYSSSGGKAAIFGVLIALDRKANLAVVYRNYDKDYNALEPNAFGESSTINNEEGIYVGFEYLISNMWKFRSYVDMWHHPWLKFGIDKPSEGIEYIAKLDFNIKRKLSVYAQYTYENKLSNLFTDESKLNTVGEQYRHRLRLHFSNNVNKNLELRTRLEISRFQNIFQNDWGYLLYQDFIFRSINSPLSLTSRIAYFDTDSFDSRIFAYGNSVLYEFSIPAYFDQGFRYYINLRYKLVGSLTTEIRFARTHKTNEDTFGSGNEEILGDTKTELKLQIRYEF